MSLDAFRDKILSNSGEERVEVNQRLLIDKILARYSTEFVIYRELMQNADDAESSSVQIKFETNEKDKVTRIIFKNDGFAFRLEDWNRLMRIAEGNPDEQKIGAFGVGFYSLFSVCENPFVSSGGQAMAFYWRGNQLFTKQGPTNDDDKCLTTFLMDMREPIELPNVEDFTRFLANSLGFTENLKETSVYFNDTLVVQLSKKMQNPTFIKIASGFNTFSPKKMFHITSVDVRGVRLDVKRLLLPTNMSTKQLCSSTTKYQTEESSILFRVANGSLDVNVSDEFSAKMERIIKKKPPNKTSIQMIFTDFDELNSSDDYHKNISPVFKDLLPYPKQGRVYIGFSTNQTTGCCSNLAARVIPTMERELIDFGEKTLAEYNSEMLSLSGTLSRILYEDEMNQMTKFYDELIVNSNIDDDESLCEWFEKKESRNKSKASSLLCGWTKKRSQITEPDEKTISFRGWLEKWAAHALTHFTFDQSNPNDLVSKMAESQFFGCYKKKLSILSSNGVLPISDVRLPNSEMEGFVKKIPLVPKYVLQQCDTFLKKAKDTMKLIEELNYNDILHELKSRVLSDDEVVKLMRWWCSYRIKVNNANSAEFMKHARIDGVGSRTLSSIRFFLNVDIIPSDIDVPFEVLPYNISKNFQTLDLIGFGWAVLTLFDWATFIVKKRDLENDPIFVEKVFRILANNLKDVPEINKKWVPGLFENKRCIPTKFGMKIPEEAYFQDVDMFPDLPTIQFQEPKIPKILLELLELLGVRKTVELKYIFNHTYNNGYWDYAQLLSYLIKVSEDLTPKELNILKNKPIWPKEDLIDSNPTLQYFVAKDLYVPLEVHREFGLPIIDWGGKWSFKNKGETFLIKLGLKRYPPLEKILGLAAPPTDPEIRGKSLQYFIDNYDHYKEEYFKSEAGKVPFLPSLDPDIYLKPFECFGNPECMIMNYQVIRQDLRHHIEKFGVDENPKVEKLLNMLKKNPPRDKDEAKKVFKYLASQQTKLENNSWNKLKKSLKKQKFIPVKDKFQSNVFNLTNPSSCFFKFKEECLNDYFTCIDFGKEANKFLKSCGVMKEPSAKDFAKLLLNSSQELWDLLEHDEGIYLDILGKIFKNFKTLSSKLIKKMERSSILLAVTTDGEDNYYHLASADEIFINDDIKYKRIFNPFTAPKKFETFYKKLGVKSLCNSVRESVIPVGTIQSTMYSQQLQKMITDRASLFYYNRSASEIKRGEDWLKKLEVREIEYMKTSFELGNTIKNEKNDLTTNLFQYMGSWIIFVTPNTNLLEISQQIVKNIYMSHDLKDISYLNMLLTASLLSLKNMGYPVHTLQLIPSALSKLFSCGGSIIDIDDIENSEYFTNYSKPVSKNTQNLRNCLQNSIKSCYSNLESISSIKDKETCHFNSESVDDQISHCEIIPGYSLDCVGTLQDIELYISKNLDQSEILSQSRTASLNMFIDILKGLADVFEITSKAIHVFYDNGNSIAFNRDGKLFFNLKFYLELHEEECKIRPTIDAMIYWFMIFCHELAHNFIESHNSEFEYYFSSFVKVYIPNLLTLHINEER